MILERRIRTATSSDDRQEIRAWFLGNLVNDWFVGELEVDVDDHEILVVGILPPLELSGESENAKRTAERARIARFREDTRERRMAIARDAEARFGRKVSWGATVNEMTDLFTTTSVPVMTRLRMDQRKTLDTLIDANVARSRSEALAWCVDLVARNEGKWIGALKSALDAVTWVRESGPEST